MISRSNLSYSIGSELTWIKENIYDGKHNEFDLIYLTKFRGIHSSPNAYLSSILVALSTEQIFNSMCFRNMVAQDKNANNFSVKFKNFCSYNKLLVAVIGLDAPFVSACQSNQAEFAQIVAVYERYAQTAEFYRDHIQSVESMVGYKLNVIWPDQLDEYSTVDTFLKKCRIH